jgi:hypothetical protein
MSAPRASQQKRRHHFVSVAYLSGFTNDKNRIIAYRKDEPSKPLKVDPHNIAFERDCYSQPLLNGGKNNNQLEDFFNIVESSWPPIVERMRKRLDINHDLDAIFKFMGSLHVRVPTTRDLHEAGLAEAVKVEAQRLDELGQLPPKPEGHEDILEHIDVAIDPHQSIHAMPDLMRVFGRVLGQIGFQIVHYETDLALSLAIIP